MTSITESDKLVKIAEELEQQAYLAWEVIRARLADAPPGTLMQKELARQDAEAMKNWRKAEKNYYRVVEKEYKS